MRRKLDKLPKAEAQLKLLQAQIGIESEEPSMGGEMEIEETEIDIEAPSDDTPMAELELEGDVSRAAAEAASALCPTDVEGLRVTSSNTRRPLG